LEAEDDSEDSVDWDEESEMDDQELTALCEKACQAVDLRA
jgi:hypothetical protein